ncbi:MULTISPECIES: MarR family winged helix-turn-helix transcriptional regulator [Citricoccus]|uniref:MarR family winged helix-turn-helix transcriptional regulator n=1 Tax=Citricoccus TaxID=169133 RepID=UPI000255F18F|nr:MarR family transcriptional regulator [Citricoccus sp. CH26A]
MVATEGDGQDRGPGTGALVGHLLRRCQQVHNVLWSEEVGSTLTPSQYSLLATLTAADDGLDQNTIGLRAGLDRSTTAGIVRRLRDQGWIRQSRDPRDGRRQVITLTAPSGAALAGLAVPVARVQSRFLEPLPSGARDWFTERLALVADVGPSGRDRRPGHLIRLAQQRHSVLWSEEVGGQLTGPQFAVLDVLRRAGGMGQGALAEASAVDRSSASDVLGRLEARGWTERTADPFDRRTRQVALTPEGRALLEGVDPLVLRVQERILAPVPEGDRDRLVTLLGRVAEGGRMPLAPGTGPQ